MSNEFKVGFSVQDITPDNMGFPLLGYGSRESGSESVHDSLQARSVVFDKGEEAWALCVLDLLYITIDFTNRIRTLVAQNTGLKTESIIIACVHTHSAPNLADRGNWKEDIEQTISDGIIAAWQNRQLARFGSGAGFLYGYHLNRRWMERSVDPSVNIIRIDDLEGNLMGIVANFGLHPVVMGADNLVISADYVGYARTHVEAALGGTMIFTNGAAADVNPITKQVRRHLSERRSFETMTGARYYGKSEPIEFADRAGGTFEECAEIGHALGDRIVYVAQGIESVEPVGVPWSLQTSVNHLDDGEELIEVMAAGFADFSLIAQPGEIFVETGLDLKAKMRKKGYRFPWVVSYANDWQTYLSPKAAYKEGGYEVMMSTMSKHSPNLQKRFWRALKKGIKPAQPMEKFIWVGFHDKTNEDEIE